MTPFGKLSRPGSQRPRLPKTGVDDLPLDGPVWSTKTGTKYKYRGWKSPDFERCLVQPFEGGDKFWIRRTFLVTKDPNA